MAAFASLAQLGSGLALALTIFVEPIAIRERRYRQKLEGAFLLIPKNGSEGSQARENEIWTRTAELDRAAKLAHTSSRLPLLVIKIGAAINFLILLLATLAPEGEVSYVWMWVFLIACVAPVSIGTVWLIFLASVKIGRLERVFQS